VDKYSEPPDAGSQAARTLIWITDLMVWDSQQILVPRHRGPPGSTSLVPREEDGVSCPRAVFDPDEPLPRIVADSRRRPNSLAPSARRGGLGHAHTGHQQSPPGENQRNVELFARKALDSRLQDSAARGSGWVT
jgi:hypothetical protein